MPLSCVHPLYLEPLVSPKAYQLKGWNAVTIPPVAVGCWGVVIAAGRGSV
jgi:hypothetical protein